MLAFQSASPTRVALATGPLSVSESGKDSLIILEKNASNFFPPGNSRADLNVGIATDLRELWIYTG